MEKETLTLRQWIQSVEPKPMEEGITRITNLETGGIVIEWK